jgi:hypothetical protein
MGIDNLSFTLDESRIAAAGTPIPLPPPVSLWPCWACGPGPTGNASDGYLMR